MLWQAIPREQWDYHRPHKRIDLGSNGFLPPNQRSEWQAVKDYRPIESPIVKVANRIGTSMTQRFYLVGAGAIAHAHAKSISGLDFDSDVFVADPSKEAREAFADKFPEATLFEDADSMFDAPARDDDIAVIATPVFAHHGPAIQALESGRHVLCEKPFALTLDEATEILATANQTDRIVASPTCREHSPATDRVAELVKEGTIGEPYHITWTARNNRSRPGIEYQPVSKWFLDRSKSGGGPVMDWGPYDAYQLQRLLDPESVTVQQAWTAQPETEIDPSDVPNTVEYHASADLTYHCGDGTDVAVSYERSWCTHGDPRTIFEIEGTQGAIRWSWLDWVEPDEVTLATDDDGERVTETIEIESAAQDNPIENMVRLVNGENAPIASGDTALFNFSVLQGIYAAAETGDRQEISRTDLP